MRTSVIPDLIDAMVGTFSGLLPDVTVSDGYPITNNPGTYLFVGVDDPTDRTPALSASATQEWPLATPTARNEDGDVTLSAESWNGEADQKRARDEVFAVAGAIQDRLRQSKTLGVPGVMWLSFTDLRLEQAQSEVGAGARLVFRVHFKARI